MRELERNLSSHTPSRASDSRRLGVVGHGRLGSLLAVALRQAGWSVTGPLGRGATADDVDAVLLCVPDAEISSAAALIAPGSLVGHCSGATGLDALVPHECFSLHPLMTIVAGDGSESDAGASRFAGATAAVAGCTPRALELARALARSLQMIPIAVADEDRVAYHAAASLASNFLITLESAAERLAASAGIERARLIPLVRATVENWARLGALGALTGPVARGDEATVARQRDAIADRAADLVPLFDALVQATRALAESGPDRAPRAAGRASTRPRVSLP